MNSHSNTEFSRATDFFGQLPSLDAPLPLMRFSYQYHQMAAEHPALNELDWVNENQTQFSHNSCSSGGSTYGSPSSLAGYGAQRPSFMQRSVSSHSLLKNGGPHPVSALFAELLDSENGPVRRVYSTGDLQVSPHTYPFFYV